MDSKKRMMFILEEDYYYITIKILAILVTLKCDKTPFSDYRKLGILLELIKENNMVLFRKIVSNKELDIVESEKALKLFCNSKIDISVIKRVLFFLEKQKIIILMKNVKTGNIDITLEKNSDIYDIYKQENMKKDIDAIKEIKKNIRGIKILKLETLQTKIWGYSEGSKWED